MTKNITVSISDDLASKMDNFKDVNWSEVCRMAISRYIEEKQLGKGEVLRSIESLLSFKLDNLTDEDKIALQNDELKRFTKRWGKPDFVEVYNQAYPYLKLSKNLPIRNTNIKSKVFNKMALLWAPMVTFEKLVKFDSEKWRDVGEGKIDLLVEAFLFNGFKVGEFFNGIFGEANQGLTQPMLGELLSENEFKATETMKREFNFIGLFAVDKDDIVFITYRKEKKKRIET